jgi:hypothetical protein
MVDAAGDPIVMERDFGSGHVLNFAVCDAGSPECLADPGFQQMVYNVVNTW